MEELKNRFYCLKNNLHVGEEALLAEVLEVELKFGGHDLFNVGFLRI